MCLQTQTMGGIKIGDILSVSLERKLMHVSSISNRFTTT